MLRKLFCSFYFLSFCSLNYAEPASDQATVLENIHENSSQATSTPTSQMQDADEKQDLSESTSQLSQEEVTQVQSLIEKAKEACEAKQYQEAQEFLEQALKIDPSNVEVNYDLATAYFSSGNYDSSVMAFERVLIIDPKNHLARLDYAKALLAQGNKLQARREFAQVLEENLPPVVRANVNLFISQIDAEEKHAFNGALFIGHTFDSNATLGTGPIQLFPGSDFMSDPTMSSDRIISTGVLTNYAYKWDKPSFSTLSSFSFVTSNYDANHQLDSDLVQTKLGIGYAKESYSLESRLNWTGIWMGGEMYQFNPGINLSGSYLVNERVSLRLGWDYFKRHHFSTPDTAGDDNTLGLLNTQQFGVVFIQRPNMTWNLSVNHKFDKSPADNETTESFNSYEAILSYSYKFAPRWTYSIAGLETRSFYNQYDSLQTSDKRNDTNLTLKTGINYAISESLMTDFGLSYTDNNSNIDRYVYTSKQASLSLTYLF